MRALLRELLCLFGHIHGPTPFPGWWECPRCGAVGQFARDGV